MHVLEKGVVFVVLASPRTSVGITLGRDQDGGFLRVVCQVLVEFRALHRLHAAVHPMHAEDEEFGENIVAEEFLKGYTYKDTVLRHSMVKVVN